MSFLAHSSDIELQLLAPLDALWRDAQRLLDTEVDPDRSEDRAGAKSPDAILATIQSSMRPPLSWPSSAAPHDAGDSTQPQTPILERAEFGMRPSERAESDLSSPTVNADSPPDPAEMQVEPAVQGAWSLPPSGPSLVGTTGDGFQSASPASGISLSPTTPAKDNIGAMTAAGRSHSISSEAASTPRVPLTSSVIATQTESTPKHSGRLSDTASLPARLAPLAYADEHDLSSTPKAERSIPSSQHPGGLDPVMQSGDRHPPTDTEAGVGATQKSHRTLTIPLRCRPYIAPELSFAPPKSSSAQLPGSDSRSTARRLLSAVEPSLEQAYLLTQARFGTPGSAPESDESPSLVRNTFNVTVALRDDDADASLDRSVLADALTEVLLAAARRHGLEL